MMELLKIGSVRDHEPGNAHWRGALCTGCFTVALPSRVPTEAATFKRSLKLAKNRLGSALPVDQWGLRACLKAEGIECFSNPL